MYNINISILLVLCFLFGCSREQIHTIVVMPQHKEIKIIDATIIEGKTTKQDLLSTIGNPGGIATGDNYSCLFYSVNKEDELWRITFVLKDGSSFTKEYKRGKGSFYIYFTPQGYVRNFGS